MKYTESYEAKLRAKLDAHKITLEEYLLLLKKHNDRKNNTIK